MRARLSIVIAIASLSAGTAGAFVRYLTAAGAPLHWVARHVAIGVSPEVPASIGLDPALAAVRDAIVAWTSLADCDPPDVSADVDAGAVLDTDDDRQSIVWVSDVGFWNAHFSSTEVARTIITSRVATGEILDADIAVNVGGFAFAAGDACDADAFDLRGALTHELGHFFGLDHSLVRSATMFAQHMPGNCDERTLDPDDVAGFCATYKGAVFAEPEPGPEIAEAVEPAPAERAEADATSGDVAEAEPRGGHDDGSCEVGSGSLVGIALAALVRRARRANG